MRDRPKFTIFPRLPTEIRLKIWRHALPGPRTIHIRHTTDYGRDGTIQWSCLHKHPTILAVSRESREEALKHYTMIHASNGLFHLAFNPHRDTIYDPLSNGLETTAFGKPPFAITAGAADVKINSIAVTEKYLSRRRKTAEYLLYGELIIVIVVADPWDWPLREGCEGLRTLEYGVKIEEKHDGWGDIHHQNCFMSLLNKEWLANEITEGADKTKGGRRRPIVKVVHSEHLPEEDDPFCVGLTPLSLRRHRKVGSRKPNRKKAVSIV